MSRKAQNSFLVLTTLGVYLGLLMVGGAAPQVLAHSATTRVFEITDEIEVKDDLDNKPSGEISLFDEISSLLDDLNELSTKGEFDWKAGTDLFIEDYSICESDNSDSFLGGGNTERTSVRVFERTATRIARGLIDAKVKAGAGGRFSGWPETVNFRLNTDESEVRIDISIAAKDELGAKRLGEYFSQYLKSVASQSQRPLPVRLSENTRSEVNDVKVILVTRLPRADLDALLAKDAK